MLASERHHQILSIINEHGTARTVELAAKFEVAEETIRRDFQILADSNQLMRIHGGASSLSGRPLLQSFAERKTVNSSKKREIAQFALDLIQPGKTYAFDSSTTCAELVSLLPNLPYRVITNALGVINYLSQLDKVDVVSTGGRLDRKTQTFVGGDSINTLNKHGIDLAFMSAVGLDSQRGASEGFEQQATFKTRLCELADETVLLIDSTKLGKRSEYFFADIKQIDHIITDSEANRAMVSNLGGDGRKVSIVSASMSVA